MPDLSGFPALDVVIGMFFLYFLLSTVLSSINEAIANLLGWRAKTLEDAIRSLVDDPKVRRGLGEWGGRVNKRGVKEPSAAERKRRGLEKGDVVQSEGSEVKVPADLTSEVLNHWRVKALVRDPESSWRRRSRPSYLPPRALSLAIAETLAKGAPDPSTGTNTARAPGPAEDAAPQDGPAEEATPGEAPHAPTAVTPWQQANEDIFAEAKDVLNKLPAGQVREVLQKAAANTAGTLNGFRVQVEHAFDDSMERASGWYKRKVQVVVLILAAVVAIGGNVDSVAIANRLWNDAPLRAAVAAKAAAQVNSEKAADGVVGLDQLQLPLGWQKKPRVREIIPRVPGWLITIAALSLGAPFWFELLGRLVPLRGSGAAARPRPPGEARAAQRTRLRPGE